VVHVPGLSVPDIGSFIREQRLAARVSLRNLAKTAGISNPYLSQVERGLRKPSAEILQQLAAGLRLSAETLYQHAGLLDDRAAHADTAAAILADPVLTERQKNALLEIYESLCRQRTHSLGGSDAPATGPWATDARATDAPTT